MDSFFKEIFTYHHQINQRLIKQLAACEDHLPARTIPLFCHSLNAQQIWNHRITKVGQPFGVHQLHALSDFQEIDQQNYRETLRILDEEDGQRIVAYQNSKGASFQNTIRDILFHVANHFRHHRGQIVSDIRQSGTAPPITDYIFYQREIGNSLTNQ